MAGTIYAYLHRSGSMAGTIYAYLRRSGSMASPSIPLPGGNASYAALCRLLLVRLPSRNTLPLPGGNATYAAPRHFLPFVSV